MANLLKYFSNSINQIVTVTDEVFLLHLTIILLFNWEQVKPTTLNIGETQVLNILDSYGNLNAAKGSLGLHRLIEALKHMFSVRMNLGDPDFVNISNTISDMLSPSYAKKLRQKIFDNTTFPPEYYMHRSSEQLFIFLT